jgi:hypothetical protein
VETRGWEGEKTWERISLAYEDPSCSDQAVGMTLLIYTPTILLRSGVQLVAGLSLPFMCGVFRLG